MLRLGVDLFICSSYSNGPWGIDHIDRVFAHETGHVFNALRLDEYNYNRCNCLYKDYGKGTCHTGNYNCVKCSIPSGYSAVHYASKCF